MKKRKKKSTKPSLFSHHKHTGRRLAHKHTSYPAVMMVILLVIFVVAGLTFKANAANVAVNAFVNGPPPSGPATITAPLDGDVFTTAPITVSGTCPIGGGNMVKIYRNGVFSGAVLCSLSGTFTLQSDLFSGANLLESKVFNAIDVEGPTSTPITVTYNPPPPPPTPPSPPEPAIVTPTNSDDQDPATQMVLKTENFYKGYFTGDTITWELELIGGKAPYALTIDWGDGGLSTVSRKTTGKFKVSHKYELPGVLQGSYPIKITATDADGGSTFLQLMVIVSEKDQVTAVVPGTSGNIEVPPFNLPLNFRVAMPIYLGLLLLVTSFWLGERQELHKLRPRIIPPARLKR
ncbi:MAG: PKD domain-containing protein [Candidatus Saccharibacteria bacterium]|nr:PKD domain-containing protein [Candidatus Saccharibacteria bacterium]